ncbi:META domain-containing protein [Qipengyuania sphaerica]|uniref:META domain-containing protein n=1 Tax=Qipengyuania sphaerica TaxID=2867243 RepID=UPI001C88D0D7|nr:META domain-containing protein [Qipengyuania sphaerica]MBX7539732.1 META domain-containing protein [Qipengyuania sphaerica]
MAATAACAFLLSACVTPLPVADRAIDQASLIGNWELARIDNHPIANAISLEFRADGNVRGAIACNSFLTDYTVAGTRIEIGNAIITAAGCHPRFDADRELQEKAEKVLFSEPPAALTQGGNSLVLTGDSVLVFERQ